MKNKALPTLLLASTLPAIPAPAKSLWDNAPAPARSAYSDRLASQPGDLLTVFIDETTSLSGTQRSSRERSSDIASEVKAFLFSPIASSFGTHKGELPQTEISAGASSEGGGTVTNRTTLRSQATVRVIDVLPNGILVVEGTRAVAFSGQKYFGKLRGFVRPADISRANTIPSSAIADAHIEYVSEGSLTQNEKEGFLTRFFNKINPF
jgi:flagellar L-ring protein precursor FlgH